MELLSLILSFFGKHKETLLPLAVLVAQYLQYREQRAWKKELLALKYRTLSLTSIHCKKYPTDTDELLVAPEAKEIEGLERNLDK